MKWKLVLRTLLYGSSMAAFVAAVHQVIVPQKAHAEQACCNFELANSCGTNARCEFTNEQCNQGPTSNMAGYTCVEP